ncbi:hypothetical protein RUM44_011527 [Polyplax serrata]|uniref:Uncharacterized protein n=1 Tax=Polyplax serrata TaxID=468196 RepID=A0ABR1AQ98_POLSC
MKKNGKDRRKMGENPAAYTQNDAVDMQQGKRLPGDNTHVRPQSVLEDIDLSMENGNPTRVLVNVEYPVV